jgi:hypothetical protein
MRRLACLAVLVVVATVVGAASAAPPDPSGAATGRALGMVPTWASMMATQWMNGAYRATYGSGALRYHGGPTQTTNTTYTIFWQPSNWGQTFPSGYSGLVNQYFGDVAADSGKTTNVYYTATQYSGIKYQSAFAGTTTATDPLPTSGCSYSGASVCMTDAQLQSEINTVINAKGWPRSSTAEYFLYTAPGVGSCSDSSHCAFTQYCAYHGWIGSGSTMTTYANMPYVENVSGCDAGYHPNGLGDATINVTSHEHNETITDENGNAWYDQRGYEDGDKCAWSWGAITGNYNQTINGNHYIAQLEYSNQDRGCVQSGL